MVERQHRLQRERTWIAAWLLSAAVSVGGGTWAVLGGAADRAVESAYLSWGARVQRCQQLVDEGRFEAAKAELAKLDRQLPGRTPRHRLATDRQLLLGLLGECELQLGHKRRCLTALERLVAFNPRTWASHHQLAHALRHFGAPEDAAASDAAVLEIHPNHLPSVDALVAHHQEARRFTRAIEVWETYLDALLVAPIRVRLGGDESVVLVVVDGRPQDVRLPLTLPPGWRGALAVATAGYSIELHALAWLRGQRVGQLTARAFEAAALDEVSWTLDACTKRGARDFVAHAAEARLTGVVAAPEYDVAAMRLRVSAFKAVTPELWRRVESCYDHALALGRLEAARARVRVGGCLEGGSLLPSWQTKP
ncbi:MAG: hypothetical protein AAF628_28880 [Planctomycetota bacterium]